MKILGVDPGTATTGYGIIVVKSQAFQAVDFGCILTKASLPLSERIQIIFDELSRIITIQKPDCVAVEEVFFAANTKTAISVGHARGAILLCASINKIPVSEYTPLQIKQAITGYGRAEKMQIQRMVKTLLNLSEIPKPDDVADALAVAICHAHSYKLEQITNNNK